MRLFKPAIFFIFLSVLIFSCVEIVDYPNIPQVKFKEYILEDSLFVFQVIDGDGDIGLTQYDTVGPYHQDSVYNKNFFMKVLERKDSIYTEFEFENPLEYRIPYPFENKPQGQNKTFKADIEVDLSVIVEFPRDSFKFEFFIYDRALHQSNIETTPAFIY